MAIYMKFNDDSIKGNVTAEGHADWIEINSVQFGVGRGIGSPTGRAANRESSEPSISEVVVTKVGDRTSPLFFQEACVGEPKAITIDFVKTDKGALQTYFSVVLTNVLISGWSASSGGDNPTESVSLNFTKIELKYIPSGGDAADAEPIPAGYDLSLGKSV